MNRLRANIVHLPSLLLVLSVVDAAAADPLDPSAFSTPPKEHHPETWFHFIGGNVAKPGITADLEAISDAGISGIQLFHGQFGGPWPGVEPQIQCLSGSWDDAVKHVGAECERLGLKFTMQNCPGWAMAGGPWINPEKAMRQLIWSRADLTGSEVSVKLPAPETGTRLRRRSSACGSNSGCRTGA